MSKLLSSIKKTLTIGAVGVAAINPKDTLSEVTFGLRSLDNLGGDVSGLSDTQMMNIATADTNGNGTVVW